MEGVGGGYIKGFAQEWIFLNKLIIYCSEILKFVVTTNWLQLSAFTVSKPCG